jgi:hypothetical protein
VSTAEYNPVNWIIANEDREVLKFRVMIFGVECTLPAIFVSEDEALEILYILQQECPDICGYYILKVSSSFASVIL